MKNLLGWLFEETNKCKTPHCCTCHYGCCLDLISLFQWMNSRFDIANVHVYVRSYIPTGYAWSERSDMHVFVIGCKGLFILHSSSSSFFQNSANVVYAIGIEEILISLSSFDQSCFSQMETYLFICNITSLTCWHFTEGKFTSTYTSKNHLILLKLLKLD